MGIPLKGQTDDRDQAGTLETLLHTFDDELPAEFECARARGPRRIARPATTSG